MTVFEMHAGNMRRFGFGIEAMKETKVCKKCGKSAGVHQYFCKNCGAFLSGKTLFDLYRKSHKSCKKCKTILAETMEYCPTCGKPITSFKRREIHGNRSKL